LFRVYSTSNKGGVCVEKCRCRSIAINPLPDLPG
jgi:hypothetical protein